MATPADAGRGGITPACAGNTEVWWPVTTTATDHPRVRGEHSVDRHGDIRMGDHPRVRGEHSVTGHGWSTPAGSPPRARGTPEQLAATVDRAGITPACAGNTGVGAGHVTCTEDHPRVRGEH